jgi:glycerol-3-phosphate dehydrogenase
MFSVAMRHFVTLDDDRGGVLSGTKANNSVISGGVGVGHGHHIDITGQASFPKEVPGPEGLPSRAEQIRRLKHFGVGGAVGEPTTQPYYDVLVIGGGATGAGCTMDAAHRGLKVACIERGDFASETSSRSTKLIWAGIRYLATASASLLSTNLFKQPLTTLKEFKEELNMVFNCHRERRYMLSKQQHLCEWIPIAVPFDKWYVSPAPFGHWLFSFFPVLAPVVFKFYDSLSHFTCPPSYIMGPTRSNQTFPQLINRGLNYCAVFYEATHNDARTNLAIALTAADEGAHIANYVEMTSVKYENDNEGEGTQGKAIGITVKDRMTHETFGIHAKHIIFAGGPFTDQLRQMETDGMAKNNVDNSAASPEPVTATTPVNEIRKAVAAASGTHLVLPGYYCPQDMGLLDYNTSDGRFLFFIPWEGHTLVGTTDTKCPAETLPTAPEQEIQWILKECGKYLSPELSVRRSDVLSAWRGWRPLAMDPHADDGAPVSRDHVISRNPVTGIHFVAGGKWTTWREMAQDMIDQICPDVPCRTLDLTLYGGQGCKYMLCEGTDLCCAPMVMAMVRECTLSLIALVPPPAIDLLLLSYYILLYFTYRFTQLVHSTDSTTWHVSNGGRTFGQNLWRTFPRIVSTVPTHVSTMATIRQPIEWQLPLY